MGRQTKIQRFDLDGFTSQIVSTMKERGTSHEALARETGLSMGLITKMRRYGSRPTADAFLALCHWLKAEPMQFHLMPTEPQTGPFAGLIKHGGARPKSGPKPTPIDLRRMKALQDQGVSMREIAHRFGVGYEVIKGANKRLHK